jgi:hypothetical protein
VFRVRVLAACAVALHATNTAAKDAALAEKEQQRRKDVLSLIVAVLDRAEGKDLVEFTAALEPLCRHAGIRQQLKFFHHVNILRKYGGLRSLSEEDAPGRLLACLYADEQEFSAVGASWEVLTTSAQGIAAQDELRTRAMEEVKSLLREADPVEAAQLLDGLKNKPASRPKKDSSSAAATVPAADRMPLQTQVNALHLWCALLQWTSLPAPEGHSDRKQQASADPVPEQLVSYQDAALKLLRGICAHAQGIREEVLTVCSALLFTARPLYSSLFLSGRHKEQVRCLVARRQRAPNSDATFSSPTDFNVQIHS